MKETIKTNADDDSNIFDAWIDSQDKIRNYKESNEIISLESFIEVNTDYKELYEVMRERYTVKHTYRFWERLAKKTKERIEIDRIRSDSDISDIEYYSMFSKISKEAASLFSRYINARKSQSSINAVSDKDINDYTVEVIRNTLNDYIGVSYNVDREAFIEICKLKIDDIENNRLIIFKDVKSTVIKYFEDLGFTLSNRNLNSIEWWINNFQIRY